MITQITQRSGFGPCGARPCRRRARGLARIVLAFLLVPLISAAWFGSPIQVNAGESKDNFLVRARRAVAGLSDARRPRAIPLPQDA